MEEWSSILEVHGGVASSRDLLGAGLRSATIRRAVTDGRLVKIRRSAYVDADRWREAASWDKHRLRALAIMRAVAPLGSYALSHHSALAVHGIGLYGVDDCVHVVGRVGQSERRARMLRVHPPVPSDATVTALGVPTVSIAVACTQLAALYGAEVGLVSADTALREGRMTAAELNEAVEGHAGARGSRAVTELARHATGKHESAGETRCGVICRSLGLPGMEPQVEIRDRSGVFVARVDFKLRAYPVVVEFDGLAKYGATTDVVAEKLREDRLRDLGYEVVRLTWSDLSRPATVRERVTRAIERSRR